MSNRILHALNGRLSLRPPQAESLARLAQALDAAPVMLKHERDVAAILATLQTLFPTLTDFEREFPSLCRQDAADGRLYCLFAFGAWH